MKNRKRVIFVSFGSLIGLLLMVIAISAMIYSPDYMYRVLINGESKVTDYQFFPERLIQRSTDPYDYQYEIDKNMGKLACIYTDLDGEQHTEPLLSILKNNDTTSIIVIQDDTVQYEKYLNGYSKDSVQTSFSSVKSVVSLLVGAAIEDGYIESVDQHISDFIPEFKNTDFESITIKNLLMMRSNIKYVEGLAWFTDDAKTYYMPDLRNLALHHITIDRDYSGQFHYNNYHPLLLGIVLERSTGQSVSDYFYKKIWNKIGAEHDASWSLDSAETGFEKMESGLNFRSLDYAKIGSMLLHRGTWNGQSIINDAWINESAFAGKPLGSDDNKFLSNKNIGYQYMWYSVKNDKGGQDFFAAGKYGQYLYISPENNVVIVRTGVDTGSVEWWPEVLKQVAAHAGEM